MAREAIDARLRRGDRLLMDGGTGSEIERRGIAITRGWDTAGDINSWSARALGEAPDVVREVHEDYLRAGADIIITNSFWANRTRMGMDGMADRSEEYTRLAGEIAVNARDSVNPDAYVAGGIAPPLNEAPQNGPELAEQAVVLADAGVDVMLAEYVGSVEDCVVAVEAVGSVGLPTGCPPFERPSTAPLAPTPTSATSTTPRPGTTSSASTRRNATPGTAVAGSTPARRSSAAAAPPAPSTSRRSAPS